MYNIFCSGFSSRLSDVHELRPNSCCLLSGRRVMWINSLTTWWKMPRQESAIVPTTSSKVTLCFHRYVIQRFKAGPHLVLNLPWAFQLLFPRFANKVSGFFSEENNDPMICRHRNTFWRRLTAEIILRLVCLVALFPLFKFFSAEPVLKKKWQVSTCLTGLRSLRGGRSWSDRDDCFFRTGVHLHICEMIYVEPLIVASLYS